jgi:hypothetical protein
MTTMISRVRIESVADTRDKVLDEIESATANFIQHAVIWSSQSMKNWRVTDDGVWAERHPQTHPEAPSQLTGRWKGRRVISYQGREKGK